MGENVFIRSNTLVKVDLSGNHIIVLTPFNFQGLKNLEELLLLRNPTMCIAVDAFAGLLKLRRLEVDFPSRFRSLHINYLGVFWGNRYSVVQLFI